MSRRRGNCGFSLFVLEWYLDRGVFDRIRIYATLLSEIPLLSVPELTLQRITTQQILVSSVLILEHEYSTVTRCSLSDTPSRIQPVYDDLNDNYLLLIDRLLSELIMAIWDIKGTEFLKL